MIPREVLEKVRRIEIKTRRLVVDALAGEYHSSFKGRGMEFSEVREYQMGDDIRTIDWNVTSRTGQLHVKKFIEERELTVLLMLDASGSADFGTRGGFKREMAAEIGALLAFSAIKNNDRVGAMVFTDDVEMYVPPRKGRGHVLRVIRDLLYFEPRGRGTSVGKACEFLNRVTRKQAVVFLLSDFIDSRFDDPLRVAAKKHDLISILISDPAEAELPPVGPRRARGRGDRRVVPARYLRPTGDGGLPDPDRRPPATHAGGALQHGRRPHRRPDRRALRPAPHAVLPDAGAATATMTRIALALVALTLSRCGEQAPPPSDPGPAPEGWSVEAAVDTTLGDDW